MSNIFRVMGVALAIAIGWRMGLVADGQGKDAKWAGERSKENGVEVVRNPAAPQFGVEKLNLRETAAIYHGESEQDVFQRIEAMAVAPDNSLYALDARQCAVYRFDGNGTFKGRFGKKGEGPGDFKYPSDLAWGDNDCLHVLDDAIISNFSPGGDLLEQFKLPSRADVFCPLSGGGFIMSGMVFTEKDSGFAVAHHDGQDGKKELFRVMNKKSSCGNPGRSAPPISWITSTSRNWRWRGPRTGAAPSVMGRSMPCRSSTDRVYYGAELLWPKSRSRSPMPKKEYLRSFGRQTGSEVVEGGSPGSRSIPGAPAVFQPHPGRWPGKAVCFPCRIRFDC